MQMTNADAFMWFLIGALTLLAAYRVWERSAVRRLRSHVQRLHDDLADARVDRQLVDENEQVLRNNLEGALLDWKRCERKLARARRGRDRWLAESAMWQRNYQNEFKRAHQAETRLMRWQYNARYATPAPAFKVVGAIAAEDLQAGTAVKVVP